MASILKSLRVASDPLRLRIILLLEREELSVAELQEILSLGQSTISTHLGQLKQAGIVEDRRTGKNILYRLKQLRGAEAQGLLQLIALLRQGMKEIPEAENDEEALKLVLAKRTEKTRAYFDGLAGRFGREYVPGRSWQGVAEMLLRLLPPMIIADLGAGEGTLSQLLAQRAIHVIAVDNSEKMVEFGTEVAGKNAVHNLEYRRGDLEALPIDDAAVDLALFSQSLHHAQHPERAIQEAHRILRPGGRIVVLDLMKHTWDEARELYADVWLGFKEVELRGFLAEAGFQQISSSVVHREPEPPKFETILVMGEK
jgi:ubiquinone/menaquinone biosynthesis C-methylase UbiE/DNA-binding transcriptional ArsR family regulator